MNDQKSANADEIQSLLSASRQLGPDYDHEIARQLAERIHSWTPQIQPPKKDERLAIISTVLALSIPILAIAVWAARADGFFAVLAMDAVIVLAALWRRE